MILSRHHREDGFSKIKVGSYEHMLEQMNFLTEFMENKGEMFVNEIEKEGLIIREFATPEDGLVESLIISENLNTNPFYHKYISKFNTNQVDV